MKKILTGLLGMVLVLSMLAGCGAPAGFDAEMDISVVSREDGSGTRGAFVELMGIEEKDANGNKTDKTTKEAIIASKTDVMLTNVAGEEYSIGYVSLGSLNETVKAVKVDGVEATADNVKNGSYKVARPFNIAYKEGLSEVANDFISYILSKEGQTIVANEKYISVDEAAPAYSGSVPAGKIVISGSSSVTPVMEKLKEGYLLVNSNAEIEIQMSDSSSGMTGAIDGTCDIGMASRDLKDSEKTSLQSMQIALDGIAVIVNPANPTEDMASDSIKNVFTGAVTTWSEI